MFAVTLKFSYYETKSPLFAFCSGPRSVLDTRAMTVYTRDKPTVLMEIFFWKWKLDNG